MGDQAGIAVSREMYYVPYYEYMRIRESMLGVIDKAELFSAFCRINTLYMIAKAGSGHIGSSFSSLDIMSWIQLNELRSDSMSDREEHVFFSSKGHDAPALYNTMIGVGKLEFELIHRLRKVDGLPGHPDISTPEVVTNTGSLGMGISKAKGIIFGNRIKHKKSNVFVLTGDGELQEGQIWESLISAANSEFHELIVIVDHNKLQSDTLVSKVSDLGDLEAKFLSFGWHVSRCDGNNIQQFSSVLTEAKLVKNQPKVIIADTIKGKGVSFMEHTSIDSDVELYEFHSGAPSEGAYMKAVQELIDGTNAKLMELGLEEVELATSLGEKSLKTEQVDNTQKLIAAYSKSINLQAEKNNKVVALNADLVLDTGLIPFQQAHPERFVECGIAEQDMVSQAGGMALNGLIPIVHSFACFLSSRPNEQIYNNATEETKIIYVGSLAGVLPGGPGHSHQAVRDISSLSAVPDLTLVQPATECEVEACVEWAINENTNSTYIRLFSLPWDVPFETPDDFKLIKGCGYAVTQGEDVVLIAYGPLMLAEAYNASKILKEQDLGVKVINLPWLNSVDVEWLDDIVGSAKLVLTLDDHYISGGQGEQIIASMAKSNLLKGRYIQSMGLDRVPCSGTNDEVLITHKLDSISIANHIQFLMKKITNA